MKGRWFVTGTDTEIGKSAATACLAAAVSARGTSVVAAKPVASGVAPGTAGEDAELLAFGGEHEPYVFATFDAPLSPHRAAALEGRAIASSELRDWVTRLQAECVLVEGVGGWRVPVTTEVEVCDLARWSEGRVIVVAADRLGVINHTRLTVEAIRRDGLEVSGIILNRGVPGDTLSRTSNLEDIRATLDLPVAVLEATDLTSHAAMAAAGQRLWDGILPDWC